MNSLINILVVLISLLSMSLQQKGDVYDDCRPFYTHNYGYKIYFHLPKSAVISNTSIYIPFSVQTSSDAHILLSTSPNPRSTEPVYEVVFGAGWNTFSDIRRLHQGSFRASNTTRSIVNKNVLKKFWIKIDNGTLSIGEDDFVRPLVVWVDKNPLNINYMSFSSWHGTTAKWYFDCWGATPMPQSRTVSESLRNYLFKSYDPYITPKYYNDIVTIKSNITINYVFPNPVYSSLELRGYWLLYWIDFRLTWNPSDFNDLYIIRLRDQKIWLPPLIVYNFITQDRNWLDNGIVTISYDGIIFWYLPINFITKCQLKMTEWPRDEHDCSIIVGLSANQHSAQLSAVDNSSLETVNRAGQWEVLSVETFSKYLPLPWDEALPEDNSSDIETSSVLHINLKVARHSTPYFYFFFVPLKVAVLVSIISFSLPFINLERLILQVIVLIMYIFNLLSINESLPPNINSSPSIVSLNYGLLVVAVVFTILTGFLIHLFNAKDTIIIPIFFDRCVDFFILRSNLFSFSGGQKLFNTDDEREGEASKAEPVTSLYKLSKKERVHVFLQILDYLLLFNVLILYSTLLIIY